MARNRDQSVASRSATHSYGSFARNGNLHEFAALAGIAIAVFVCFGTALAFDFVIFDDAAYTSLHSWVRSGLSLPGIAAAFRGEGGIYWHPLTWISHMVDVSLFGLDGGWHHLQSILWHLGGTFVLFFLARRFGLSTWAACAGALLWAIHPLRVESVVWVAERKDVLCGFFWLLSIWFYARYAESPKASRYVAFLAVAALAYMAKPTAITLPFVLLVLDWWPLRRKASWTQLLLEKLPLFAFSAGLSWVTFAMQEAEGAFTLTRDTTLIERLHNAAAAYCWYLGKTIWPADLAVLYPYPDQIPTAVWTGALVLLAGITALALQHRERFPSLLAGWLCFVGALVPVIGLVQAGPQPYADRFTYLPAVFLTLAPVAAMARLAAERRIPSSLLSAAAVLLIAAIGARTVTQVKVWKDSETLFAHTVSVTEANPFAEMNLGSILIAKRQYKEALEHLQVAAREMPDYAPNHFNLGQAYFGMGRFLQAKARFQHTIALHASHGGSDFARGDLWIWLGNTEARLGNEQAAIAAFEQGIAAGATQQLAAEAHNTLAILLAGKKRHTEAESHFRAAIAVNPDYENARMNLAVLLSRMDRHDEAVKEAQEVLRRNPQHVQAQALVRALGN